MPIAYKRKPHALAESDSPKKEKRKKKKKTKNIITIKNKKEEEEEENHEPLLNMNKRNLITEPLKISSPNSLYKTYKDYQGGKNYKQSPTFVKIVLLISSILLFYNPNLICPILHQTCFLFCTKSNQYEENLESLILT
jgi:hypothetical protein